VCNGQQPRPSLSPPASRPSAPRLMQRTIWWTRPGSLLTPSCPNKLGFRPASKDVEKAQTFGRGATRGIIFASSYLFIVGQTRILITVLCRAGRRGRASWAQFKKIRPVPAHPMCQRVALPRFPRNEFTLLFSLVFYTAGYFG
jgi:hypothetical protein